MEATIRIEDDDPSQLLSLLRWLQRDETLVGRCTISGKASDDIGHMGGGEVISLVLSHLTAVASLAIAYASWRDSRPRSRWPKATLAAPGVELVFDQDDLRITVRNASAEAIDVIVEAVVSVVRIDAAAG